MILSYLRTLFLYLVLIFAVRLMGKRQIGGKIVLNAVMSATPKG